MRTNIVSFILASENRIRIVKALSSYPQRQWSCTFVEEIAKLPHATVFRTLRSLRAFGLLKSVKINKRDLLYEVVSQSPQWQELQRVLDFDKITMRNIAEEFTTLIRSREITAVILYGSSVQGDIKPESDIDILVICENIKKEAEIQDIAAQLSTKVNKTISVVVMTLKQFQREKNSSFTQSIQKSMEVLYGKNPF